MKSEITKIGHIEYRKDCAKGMSYRVFLASFSADVFDYLDKEKAFVLLAGKIESKKVFKKALGALYKQRLVELDGKGIRKITLDEI